MAKTLKVAELDGKLSKQALVSFVRRQIAMQKTAHAGYMRYKKRELKSEQKRKEGLPNEENKEDKM